MRPLHTRLYALLILSTLLALSLFMESCTDSCTDTMTYTYYEPVYTPLAEIRSAVGVVAPQPLTSVGKIYFKDGYLFVNDPGKGIHVIDNTDPAHPVKKHFITIPGNYDVAIRNNILYADSFIDLVALDISNLNQVVEVARLENIFNTYSSLGFQVHAERGVVTDWVERKEVTVERSACGQDIQPWGGFFFRGGIAMMDGAAFSSAKAIAPGNSTGIGGSMARFTLSGDQLYMLDGGFLRVADVQVPAAPAAGTSMYINWDIETIFPDGNHLFIGARSGMHILDISAPTDPVRIATYAHVNSCDPVVVSGNYAYVTLRSGTQCAGFNNQLDVLDISNITQPTLVKTYPMHNPHGLGIDADLLFICDGAAGLKIYHAQDKLNIDKHLIKHYKNIHAYDAIPFNQVLMLIGADGIFQYDYSDVSDIKQLSHLVVEPDL